MNLFSDSVRRDPFPVYSQLRRESPAFYIPPPFNGWTVFDYETVKRMLNNHHDFSSAVPAPKHWFIFLDPPAHSQFRALVSRAFTPKSVSSLEPFIRETSRELLDAALERDEIDFVSEFAAPFPLKVIAAMIGIPASDWSRLRHWSDVIMKISYARSGGPEAAESERGFREVSAEMADYLGTMIRDRCAGPRDDLLSRLLEAEVDGTRLSPEEILGLIQLLIVAGQETTTNLINNALLCFLEHPDQRSCLRSSPELLPGAIEEVLRYRSPLQWVMRTPRREIEVHGKTIPAGAFILAMIGSANRDPTVFPDAERFDIRRSPNPHIAFGHGIHSCLGASLARMEATIALSDFFSRVSDFEYAASETWTPRAGLNVHGPARLPLRWRRAKSASGVN